jgi:uncharacterized repeat protein (TIGR03803 family)
MSRLTFLRSFLAFGIATNIASAQSDGANAGSVTFTALDRFTGANGLDVTQPLVQASNGELYGTSILGGSGTYCGGLGCGTIFKITLSGALTTLYSFLCTPSACPNGDNPNGALVQATNGDLYAEQITI